MLCYHGNSLDDELNMVVRHKERQIEPNKTRPNYNQKLVINVEIFHPYYGGIPTWVSRVPSIRCSVADELDLDDYKKPQNIFKDYSYQVSGLD